MKAKLMYQYNIISSIDLQLSLNDNELTGNLESVLDLCPEVSHVGLAGNRIADLAELKPLVSTYIIVINSMI